MLVRSNEFVFLRESLAAQLELTTTKAESEQLARQIAEDGVSSLPAYLTCTLSGSSFVLFFQEFDTYFYI